MRGIPDGGPSGEIHGASREFSLSIIVDADDDKVLMLVPGGETVALAPYDTVIQDDSSASRVTTVDTGGKITSEYVQNQDSTNVSTIHLDDGKIVKTQCFDGESINESLVRYDAEDRIVSRSETVIPPSGPSSTTNYNASGEIIAVSTRTTYPDDGSSTETMRSSDGRIIRTNRDGDGKVTSTASIEEYDDGSRKELVTYGDARQVTRTYDENGTLIREVPVESSGQKLAQAGATLIDALSLIKAIQSGNPLPVLASGLRVANDLTSINSNPNIELSSASNVAMGLMSLYSLSQALERRDTLAALTASAQALNYSVMAYTNALTAQYGGDAIEAIAAAEGNAEAFPSAWAC